MSEQNDSSFIRWQGYRIGQFGFVNNLFVTLASGFLILEAQSIISATALQSSEALSIGISAIFVFTSLITGCGLAINRLTSFRNTAQTARKRETKHREGIDNLRSQTDDIDKRSWKMLWWQIGLFAFGSMFLVVTIILSLAQFVVQ